MSRFPLFNSAPSDSQDSHIGPMEIDEGDDTITLDDLSFDSKPTQKTAIKPTPVNMSVQKVSRDMAYTSPSNQNLSLFHRAGSFISGVFSHVDDDTLRKLALFPYVMSGYVQLLFNISLPAFFLYWVYSFACTIQSDVEKKVLLFSEEVMEQIAKCSRDYRENRCDPATRVPALVSACQAWEECMARDPHLVAKRSGISAEIFGETLNSFFNVLSWKTLISLIVLIIGFSVIFNLTFSMSRKSPDHEAIPIKRGKQGALANGSPMVSRGKRRF